MSKHDPLCAKTEYPEVVDWPCECVLIAKVRAEYEGEREAWEETMRRYVSSVLADLRANVEALDVFVTTNNLLGTTRYVRLGDVLDLIDGSSDE